jgi:hypothetical protein
MDFLPEEICLKGEKNFGAFNFAQVENQGGHFLSCSASSISEAMQEVTERSSLVDDALKNLFFLRLER